MAILLSCQNLGKRFGSRPLFEGLSFGLFENERTGLIGPNGTGKSTLLKILAGLESPDSGEVSRRRGLKVGYLPQSDFSAQPARGETVRDELAAALTQAHMEDYERDLKLEEILEGSGFQPDQKVSQLSGGWRKRLAILSQVITKPDLLLLDEPTNHLDVPGVCWLEDFLTSLRFSFLMVTHDRRFLESVCNRVIELHKRYEGGYLSSQGSYSKFLETREAYFAAQVSREDSTRNIVRQEIEWLRRGAKARTTKQKARIDRAGLLMEDLKDLEYRNSQTRTAAIDFSASARQTKKLISFEGIEKLFGNRRLFGPLDLILGPSDKLGLLGGNGSGKSTLLKILAGTLSADSGRIKRAEGLRVVTFDQHRDQLDLSMTLRRALCSSGEHVHFRGNPIHVAAWADRFLFAKSQLEFPLNRLSGGEQSRVLIAQLMLKPADVLLLDEPTNDLDIDSLEILERSMKEFEGALVLVTHDRYLLDRVSKGLLVLDGKGGHRFLADLAQWEDLEAEKGERPIAPAPTAPPNPAPQIKKGLSQKEQKELRFIEATLRDIESKINKAKESLADPTIASNAGELVSRQKVLDQLYSEFDEWVKKWEVLEERR